MRPKFTSDGSPVLFIATGKKLGASRGRRASTSNGLVRARRNKRPILASMDGITSMINRFRHRVACARGNTKRGTRERTRRYRQEKRRVEELKDAGMRSKNARAGRS